VTFSWTCDGRDVTGQLASTGNTSMLTITSVRSSDDGSYVCTLRSGSLSVMSNTATPTVYGMFCMSNNLCDSLNEKPFLQKPILP